ncbi:MAG: hypothetical protein FJ077_16195 [Cyanobacteria bacterium K_DeepCast_35m_m2_023]|nr:hypothetical protein [Cyanobacteria bacterium K_DeepCast_35m_m2_023]
MVLKRSVVAFTPLLGALSFPLIVPLLMSRVSIQASILAAVLVATAWFVLMLRTAEMPGHH